MCISIHLSLKFRTHQHYLPFATTYHLLVYDAYLGLSQHVESRGVADGLFDLLGGADDLPGGLDVALAAVVHEGGPAGGHDAPRPRAPDGRRGVDAAGPVGRDEELVVAVLRLRVHEHRGALGRVAVLQGGRGRVSDGEDNRGWADMYDV